ncbi:DUF3265 domain-containing protein [Vibrio cincinnatiensis]|nr:DUF3265 domain-containing protein [Vibrio cincinnatiensis]
MAFKARRITNASIGTSNARHFWFRWIFEVTAVREKS